jgi:hypothetical protein
VGEFSKTGCPVLVSVLFAETGRGRSKSPPSRKEREKDGEHGMDFV